MDPECDIYQNEEIEEGGDPYQTRPISKDELSQIRDHHRRKIRETGADEAEKGTEGLETSDEENGSPDSLSKEDAEEFGDGTGDHRSRYHSSRKREFHKKIPSRKRDEDVSTQFERMIAAIGIIAAILVVIVVVFCVFKTYRAVLARKRARQPGKSDRGGHPVRIYGGNSR